MDQYNYIINKLINKCFVRIYLASLSLTELRITSRFQTGYRFSSLFFIFFSLNKFLHVIFDGPRGTEEYREGRLRSNANAMGLSSDLNVGTQDNDTQMFM